MKNERYYYNILTPDEKKVYRWIFEAIVRHDEEIKVPMLVNKERIVEIFFSVLNDDPMLYYVSPLNLRAKEQPGLYTILPQYLYTVKEIEKLNQNINDRVKKICQRAMSRSTDQFDLEKYYHNIVAKNVAYDYDYVMRQDDYTPHSIVGAFVKRQAVCDGISKAFKLLCNMSGIKCMVVTGEANGKGNFAEAGMHAWNMVRVKGESYYVDVTWDAITLHEKRYIRYDYFNVPERQFKKTHRLKDTLPSCTATDLNYFYYSGNIVESYKELKKLVSRELSKSVFTFQIRKQSSEFLTEQQIREKTSQAISDVQTGRERGKAYYILFDEVYWIVTVISEEPEK